MICEVCKKNKAVVHFINIISGKKTHQMLCENCALKINNISLPENNEKKEDFDFRKILNGLFEYMNGYDDEIEEKEINCKFCNRSYEEFKETGICSCSECYKYFSEKFEFLEEREYKGKIPKGKNILIGDNIKLKNLKLELNYLIEDENYEEAIKVRDEIELLKKKIDKKERGNGKSLM